MRFKDKVVVVSGAGAGIGKGIALGFGSEGARVAVAEINRSTGEETVAQLKELGREALYVPTDVSDPDSVQAAVKLIAEHWGTIDVVINNAGVTVWKGIKELSSEEWDRVLGVDLKGIFLLSKFCVPYMRDSAVRSIVNIASVHAYATVPNYDAYAASKGGVVSLTRSMALTLKEDGIRVNGICPGFIDTEMLQHHVRSMADPQAYMDYVLSIHTVNRIGTPADIANTCKFLCSEEAYFINGEVITVDGGLTIQLKH